MPKNLLIQDPVEVAQDHFLLRISVPAAQKSSPGQFINIRAGQSTDPLVRRPFSLYDHQKGIIEVIVKKIGKGTGMITDFKKDQQIDFLGPIGKGFSLISGGNALLIGGGTGNAPLYYLSKELKKRKSRISYIYGARSKKYIYLLKNSQALCDDLFIVTDDGSMGKKNLATDMTRALLQENSFDFIYSCGPVPMMKALSKELVDIGTPFEVSVENYFGCGIGLCSGCTVETEKGNVRACVDGPVLDGKLINWDSLG